MAFGISFGSKKQSGTSSTVVDKTEDTTQVESGTKTSTGTTVQTGLSSTESAQSGTTSQETASSATGSQTSQQSGTQFSEPVLSTLEGQVQSLFSSLPGAPMQLESGFNRDQFVSEGMRAAESQIQGDLEASLNSMFDQFGGRDDQNSMSALLANRARGDAGAALAGAHANLTAKGSEIERDRFLANLQGVGQQEGFLTQVLSALKGGRTNLEGATQTQQDTTGATTGSFAQTGRETTQSQQITQQQLVEALQSMLSGTTHTTGTEATTQKGKTGGFGFGLSI